MAVSNSIGSNVFDILVGLGLPWTLQTLAVDYGSTVSTPISSLRGFRTRETEQTGPTARHCPAKFALLKESFAIHPSVWRPQ